MKTRKCPFCGEEILAVAKKCKFCGEWLKKTEVTAEERDPIEKKNDNNIENDSEETSVHRIISAILYGAIGFCCFHFGSWNIAFNTKISVLDQILSKADYASVTQLFYEVLMNKSSDIILNSHSVLIRINDTYYGFINNARFFDSPVIQWIMLGIALMLFWEVVSHIFNID